MSIKIDGTTISIIQGDSGVIRFNSLSEGMLIYFAVRNKKYELMFPEIKGVVDNDGEITFKITSQMSDSLNVKYGERYTDYLYGLKQVDTETGDENTIFLGLNPKYEDKYILRVYPKKVEGI